MTRQEIIDLAKKLPGVEYEYKTAWEADVLTVGGKMFAFLGEDKQGNRIVNLKNTPPENLVLREKYPEWVAAGYYSNKDHWNSWYWAREGFDSKLLEEQVRISYQLVWGSLPRGKREEIAGSDEK